jgi:hypothetical protein
MFVFDLAISASTSRLDHAIVVTAYAEPGAGRKHVYALLVTKCFYRIEPGRKICRN